MLSTFFSNFGRPWLKTVLPTLDPKAQPDDSNNPNEDKDQEVAESEDKEVVEEQLSTVELEEEDENLEIEQPEDSSLTPVEIEAEQPEETLPSPGETTILGTENEVTLDLETNSIEQEVSLPETEDTTVTANSEELKSENDSLLQAAELTSDPPEVTVKGSTEVIDAVKDVAEPVTAPEEEVKETALSSGMTVAEVEVNSTEAAVESQLQENVREKVVLAEIATEGREESVQEIQQSKPEIGNLEVLQAKMETLVAAMNNQKVEMVEMAEETPPESSGNIEAVQVSEIVKEVAAAIEGTVKGGDEVTVNVTSLTANDNKGKDDPVLHPAKESGINPIEEALVTTEPIPILKEENSGKAPVQEGPTDLIEEASSDFAITTDIDGKEDDELTFVKPQIEEVSDELQPSSTKEEREQSETVGNDLDKDSKAVPAGISADSANSTEIFNIMPGEELADVNAVLRKYGIKFKRKIDSEDQRPVTVKITKQT